MRFSKILSGGLLVTALVLTTILPGMAASTPKSLSTNFTLVNLGSGPATGAISYVKPDGSQWKPDESFSISTAGGQAMFRQYLDSSLPSGQGSVVVSADQPLGAVVQIQARNQVPTMGAYTGVSQGSGTMYVPLVLRKVTGASGVGNSQITVQNTGTAATDVTITLVKTDGGNQYQKAIPGLQAGASFTYDLADESASNVPDSFLGSAVVSAASGGQVTVVSNLFTGSNGMQTFNAFAAPATSWLVPQFSSRLTNGLSTPIAIQNLSGGTLAAGSITMTCTKNPNSAGTQSQVVVTNPAPVGNSATFNINPVTNMALPDNWYGACTIASTGGVVAFVQMRVIGTDRAAAYEAIRGDGTDKQVIVPLVAKRLANGFATVTDIINLSASADAHATFTYIPSPEYVAAGGGSQNIVINNVTIPAGQMIQHNLRLDPGISQLPNGWYGSLLIQSQDQPVNAILEMTMLSGDGDTYQAHNVFTKP